MSRRRLYFSFWHYKIHSNFIHIYCKLHKKTIAIWSYSAYTAVTILKTFAEKKEKNRDRIFWFHQNWNERLCTNWIDSYFAFAFAQRLRMNMVAAMSVTLSLFDKIAAGSSAPYCCFTTFPLAISKCKQHKDNHSGMYSVWSGRVSLLSYVLPIAINKMFFSCFFFFKKQQQYRHLFQYLHTSLIVSSTHVDIDSTQFSRWQTKKTISNEYAFLILK